MLKVSRVLCEFLFQYSLNILFLDYRIRKLLITTDGKSLRHAFSNFQLIYFVNFTILRLSSLPLWIFVIWPSFAEFARPSEIYGLCFTNPWGWAVLRIFYGHICFLWDDSLKYVLLKYYVSNKILCIFPLFLLSCECLWKKLPSTQTPTPTQTRKHYPSPPQKKTATTKQKQKTKNKKTDPSFTLMTESLSNMTGEALCKGLRWMCQFFEICGSMFPII